MIAGTSFAGPLTGQRAELLRSDGGTAPLDVERWRGTAAGEDVWLLGRCRGATIDLGCGPGRLLEALAARGVAALGVDVAAEAIAQCRRRGVAAVRADVFDPLPHEGTWAHVLLADGNLGIGGDPVALLRRAALLLAVAGTVLVELDAAEPGLWCGSAQVRSLAAADVGAAFPWASAGPAALPQLAARAGLRPRVVYRGRRHFAELVPIPYPVRRVRTAPTRGGGSDVDAVHAVRTAGHRGVGHLHGSIPGPPRQPSAISRSPTLPPGSYRR